jgi:hypothetical protein
MRDHFNRGERKSEPQGFRPTNLWAADVLRLSQKQFGHTSEDRHPEWSRRMMTVRQKLSHGSTPLTMTFRALSTALVDLLGQSLLICHRIQLISQS